MPQENTATAGHPGQDRRTPGRYNSSLRIAAAQDVPETRRAAPAARTLRPVSYTHLRAHETS
ncbi:hypothetical protein KZ846_32955, partial [Pseudomonas aeruginosa]